MFSQFKCKSGQSPVEVPPAWFYLKWTITVFKWPRIQIGQNSVKIAEVFTGLEVHSKHQSISFFSFKHWRPVCFFLPQSTLTLPYFWLTLRTKLCLDKINTLLEEVEAVAASTKEQVEEYRIKWFSKKVKSVSFWRISPCAPQTLKRMWARNLTHPQSTRTGKNKRA